MVLGTVSFRELYHGIELTHVVALNCVMLDGGMYPDYWDRKRREETFDR